MDRWIGKVAVVTGASSGLGEAISVSLVEHGVNVVGLARRLENMQKIADDLKNAKGRFYPMQCDVTVENNILKAFRFAETLGGVSILVNNAGLAFAEYIIDGTTENFKTILDVNVLSAAICTREAAKSMRNHNAPGHIINISSVLGNNASSTNAPMNLYQVSKHAVTAMSNVVRNEIANTKLPIKVTNLSPGLVNTEMPIIEAGGGDYLLKLLPHLQRKDISDAVLYVLGTPPNVQVTELTITALHAGRLDISHNINPKN